MRSSRSSVIAALAAAALMVPAPALADDFQQWLTLSAKVDVSDSVVIQNELIARFSDDDGGLYELENALMLGYKLPSKVTVWAGYVHAPQYSGGDFAVMERRARQQISIDDLASIGTASLSARVRVEQRWREGVDGTGWRVRPYAKLAVPLGGKEAPTLNVTAEPFINLSNPAFQRTEGLDRIRSGVSLGFPLAQGIRLEAGYLNQHRFVRGGPDSDEHALTVALAASF